MIKPTVKWAGRRKAATNNNIPAIVPATIEGTLPLLTYPVIPPAMVRMPKMRR
jgi:hypothetical protein